MARGPNGVSLALLSIQSAWCGVLGLNIYQFWKRENPTELCVYLVDWWFWGSTCVVVVLAVSRIFVELSRLKDRISMAKEILTTVGVWLTFAAPYFGILVLHRYARVDMPRQIGFLLWLSVFFTLGSTFIIEPRRRQGKVYLCRMKSTKVAIIVDDATTAAWREKWNSSEVEKYVAHAEQAPVKSVFEQFRGIVDTYILAGSELAINIQTTMQNKILEIGSKNSFVEAEMETRRDVFNASKAEIFKLLDDNLIQSFWASTLFLDSCKRWQEALDAASLDGARLQDEGVILGTSRNTRLLSISTLTSLLGPSTSVEN